MSKNQSGLRSRILAIAVAGALGVAGTAMAATPTVRSGALRGATAAAPAGAQFQALTKATQLRHGDQVVSPLALNKPVRVSVVLKLRDDAGMQAYIANRAPGARRMNKAQLQQHLPTRAQAEAVANYLKGAGFSNVEISSNRMIVNATGSAAAVKSAFKTSLVNVKTADGRNAFANDSAIQIPASLKGSVQAVLGLQTVYKFHTLRGAQVHAQPGISGHFPSEFGDIYGASSLPTASDINVGVWGWGSMENSVNDLNDYTTLNGMDPVNITVVCTDYSGYNAGDVVTGDPTCNNVDQGQVEWSMDSQSIMGMTGGVASMTFYAAYGGYSDSITNALNEIVNPTAGEPLAQVINASFGMCERAADANQGGDGSAQAQEALFQIAAAQGQTFSVSTGDSGADNCGDGQLNSASWPSSSAWVVAAAGTTLRATTTTWARENVWRSSGGSPSSITMAQSWQAPLTYGPFAGARGPDVAFAGNPSSGALVLVSGSFEQIGGTSLSAPLFAGAWARLLQSNPNLGFAAPNLYTLPGSVLHDVRAGNNGGWIAKRGWDYASGLGSFDVARAAAVLASVGPPCVLDNGVPATGLSGDAGGQVNCSVAIPEGASNLVISITGGTGDADLYVKFGAPPTLSDYDCRPFIAGNEETCSFPTPSTGTYYVMVNGFSAFSDVTLEATWDNP